MSVNYVLGIDFGTDSVRTVLIDAANGHEAASAVFFYPRWNQGLFCDPSRNRFRQHPKDYLEGLEHSVRQCLSQGPAGCGDKVAALSIDTTGSTPAPIGRDGTLLSLRPEFAENPNAMFILWKDHTAVQEAEEINRTSRTWGGTDFTRYCGGIYSSEWFFAKILHILRRDKAVQKEAFSWVEHCDWIPAVLTGTTAPERMKRSACAAGHKAMWHASWDGLPSDAFFEAVDPCLAGLRDRLYQKTYTADKTAGTLTRQWAQTLGLSEGIPVGIGAFDAHMGAVGGGIAPGVFVRVMGTSTCDMLICSHEEAKETPVRGICGQVDGSIVPGFLGLEAGQSAFGDIFAWFRNLLAWPTRLLTQSDVVDSKTGDALADELTDRLIPCLSEAASWIPIDESCPIAVDWLNGRRTPDANQALKGAITGLSLGSDAPRIFRALVEAAAFGSRAIVDRFTSEGVPIREVVAIGGVAKKSPFVMQVLANVLNLEIKVVQNEQTVALGAAMFAAVAGGLYATVEQAQAGMGSAIESVYHPDPEQVEAYDIRYARYHRIGAFIERELAY